MCSEGFCKLLGPYQREEAYVILIPITFLLVAVLHPCWPFFLLKTASIVLFVLMHVFFPDQRALGMSMRVERSSLEQVG